MKISNLSAGLMSLVLIISSNAGAQSAEIKFFDLQALVLKNNPSVLAAQKQQESQKTLEGSWGRSFLPDVQAQIGQERFKLGNTTAKDEEYWTVEATVNLFRGGADLKEEKLRELNTVYSQLESQSKTLEVLQNVYQSYWDISHKMELKKIQQEHLILTEKNLQEAQRRIQAGISSQTDRLEFQMKLTLLKQELAVLDREIKFETEKLALALGVNDSEKIKPQLAHIHEWESSLGDSLNVESMALKKARVQKDLAEASQGKATAGFMPEIDAYAGVASPNGRMERDLLESEREEKYLGLRASWSLGKTIDSAVQRKSFQAQVDAQKAESEYQSQLSDLTNKSTMAELKTLHSFVHDSEENIKVAHGYFNQTLKEYGRGVKNSLDVLAATEKYIATQVKLAEITRDFNSVYAKQLAFKQVR